MSRPGDPPRKEKLPAFKPDPTLLENISSKEVVGATVDKISKSLGGRTWLKEIAAVESQFGTHPRTYREGYHGGIWQVDPIGFEQTKNNPKLEKVYKRIQEDFGVDYNNLSYEELRKPLYSGLAARLYLMDRVGNVEPKTVVDRARAWKVHYNTKAGKGTVPMYIRKVKSAVFDEEKPANGSKR